MNSALLKEREEFRKRAMAVPVVENKKRKVEEPAKKAPTPKPASTEKVKVYFILVSSIVLHFYMFCLCYRCFKRSRAAWVARASTSSVC